MYSLFFLLLTPLLLTAQYTFGPTQIDDGRGDNFYYPVLKPSSQGNLLAIWGSTSDTLIQASGRLINFDGTLQGDPIDYQEVIPIPIVCPPKINVFRLSDGGEARSVFHA